MVINQEDSSVKTRSHDIPIDHLDFKYVEKCENVNELEKIYKVLASGVEGKYSDLENFVFEKIKKLSPTSRILRKDVPIISKASISKNEQALIDKEINDFLINIPDLEKKVIEKSSNSGKKASNEEKLPPVRNANQKIVLDSKNDEVKTIPTKNIETNKKTNKSVKPKDYREWEKIEKMIEKETDEKDSNVEKPFSKVASDKTVINTGAKNAFKNVVKELPQNLETEELDDEMKLIKADQEKSKGNESYNAGSFDEAIVYYTRSIQLMPNAASYNNRAMTYIKLEKWDKAVEDCNEVLKYESENVKALLRRSTALSKKGKYEQALGDIEKCIRIEPNNKKTQELKKQLEASIKKETEEKERIKSIGGNRLKIEETDGSESEKEEDEKKEKRVEKPKSTTRIKIAEVESDDEDEKKSQANKIEPKIEIKKENPTKKFSETFEPVKKETETKKIVEGESVLEVKKETSEPTKKEEEAKNVTEAKKETEVIKATIEPIKKEETKKETEVKKETNTIKIDLPENVTLLKEKAYEKFTSGQYGEASDIYSKVIHILEDLLLQKKTESELCSYYKNSLAIFYNNRATCNQKICDYKQCIKDCDSSLQIISSLNELDYKSLKLKLISKKANALEMLEKYAEAFVEYEHLMRVDSSFKDVQLGYNRVRKILSETGQLNKLRSPTNSTIKETVDKTKVYDEFKSKGNECVKSGDYLKACELYTKCIELDPASPVAYLNRSLCLIKLNKPDEAISDCSFVLSKESGNVKALFRRASANRIKGNLSLVEKDLNSLLSIEPNNQIAIREMESVRKEIDEVKEKIEPVQFSGEIKAKKSKIEPVDDIKPQIVKTPKTSKVYQFSKITNAYEFIQAWNSINPREIEPYAVLLSKIDPNDLAKLIGSKLDDEILSKIIIATHKLTFEADFGKMIEFKTVDYLRGLSKTARFNVTKLFMETEQKNMVRQILEKYAESANYFDELKTAFDL